MKFNRTARARSPNDRGVALVTTLAILAVVTLLAISAYATATWEARMARDVEYRDRAFVAAEFALEQAMRSPSLATTYTRASPLVVPATGDPAPVPGRTDTWAYRLYYDPGAGTSPLPGDEAPGMVAYHFVVEATGRSLRGATDDQVLGFYVLRPAGWIPGACDPEASPCAEAAPRRTWWRQAALD